MASYTKALSVNDLPAGTMKTVILGGRKIALACVEGEYFAVSDVCTHEECSLGTEGFLDDGVITCGCHGAQFDIKTGDVMQLPATQPLKTYEVKVENDDILVNI